jgi:hypothetical protein
MKLYTKEMFLIAAEKCEISMIDSKHVIKYIDEYVTPIELPSDEEINEVAMVVYGFNAKDIKDVLEYKAFKRGAKWMRNKIQGGNNGHI